MTFLCVKLANTKIQMQKIKNTKYTSTQIHHMTKCQKDPACGIFLKRGLFRDFKNYIPMCRTHKYKFTNPKYTNTAYDKVPERLNMWYIFEHTIVQGCPLHLLCEFIQHWNLKQPISWFVQWKSFQGKSTLRLEIQMLATVCDLNQFEPIENSRISFRSL